MTGADAPWYFGSTADYPLLSFDGQQPLTQFDVAGLVATPGNTQTTLTWIAEPGDSVTGWEFTYKTQAAGSWTSWADVPSSVKGTRSHVVGSLVNGTTYLFKVRAKGSGGIIGTESMVALAVPGAAVPVTDFDSNDNNLIEISTLAQLHAMRFDPDGDGIPSDSVANKLLYHNAFKTSQVGPFCDACVGYELMNDLDFNTGEVTRSDDTYYNGGSGCLLYTSPSPRD